MEPALMHMESELACLPMSSMVVGLGKGRLIAKVGYLNLELESWTRQGTVSAVKTGAATIACPSCLPWRHPEPVMCTLLPYTPG
jgi:hypothetical protein